MSVREVPLGDIARFVRGVSFKPDAVTAADGPDSSATNRDFTVGGIVAIALVHLAEVMIVGLPRHGSARGDDVSVAQQELTEGSGIVAARFQGFDVGQARHR